MNRFKIFIYWILFSAIYSAYGVEYTNAFLDIGVGARAMAMGGAFTSLANDGASFYWNPAGLARIRKVTLSGMYGPQFGDLDNPMGQFHTLGVCFPMRGGATIGVHWIRFSVDDIPVYPELQGNTFQDRLLDRMLRPTGEPDGFFANREDAIFFSFAKMNRLINDLGWDFYKVRMEIPIGVNIKWIKRQLGEAQANGLGIDAGFQFRFHLGDFFQNVGLGIFSVGMNFQDLTKTTMNWSAAASVTSSYSEQTGRNLRWGLGYTHPILKNRHILRIAWDHNNRWHQTQHLGLEYAGLSRYFIRLGLDDGNPTGGMGLAFWHCQVDYAFLTHEFDNLHRLSFGLTF